MNIRSNEPAIERRMQAKCDQRSELGLLRERSTYRPISASRIELNGHLLVHFGSNDYLSLAWSPLIRQAVRESLDRQPTGSGASPLISGRGPLLDLLEQAIAEFENANQAIVFSSGYAANVGTIDALTESGDLIFSDSLNHASLIDGCRISRAETHIYDHGDANHLETLLKQWRHKGQLAFIVTDSVFSMDGDEAPLVDLADLAIRFDASLIVDEAHATGVLGTTGKGLFEKLNVDPSRAFRIGTLSKAIGSIGGFASGSQLFIDYLRNFARPYIYSTAMPASSVAASLAAIRLLPSMTSERKQLSAMSASLRSQLRTDGWNVPEGDSPIIPVYLHDVAFGTQLASRLRTAGFLVPFIRPPTVPNGKQMLRISLNSSHTRQDLDSLRQAFQYESEKRS